MKKKIQSKPTPEQKIHNAMDNEEKSERKSKLTQGKTPGQKQFPTKTNPKHSNPKQNKTLSRYKQETKQTSQ